MSEWRDVFGRIKQPLRVYRGWSIYDNGAGSHPVTGRFMAHRHGVRIGASTQEALIDMIGHRPDVGVTPRATPYPSSNLWCRDCLHECNDNCTCVSEWHRYSWTATDDDELIRNRMGKQG